MSAPLESGIETERAGAVATVTLSRPAQRNALSDELLAGLARLLGELDEDATVRAIVITGSTEVFASGADIRALLERDAQGIYDGDRARHWDAIRGLRTPIVAAVSGLCLGAGCELAMMADVVIAADGARFGLPETVLGLIPGAGGTQLLPRAIGKAKAMDVVLTGRLLSAQEAERAGLVSRVVDEAECVPAAREAAETIAGRPPVAQRLAKEAVEAAFEVGLHAGLGLERRAFAMAFATDDAREGLTAFAEKRTARFSFE